MRAFIALFGVAETLIQSTLTGAARSPTKLRGALSVVQSALIALRVRAVGTPTTPGKAWKLISDAYRKAREKALKDTREATGGDVTTPLGDRHQKSAHSLFASLAERLDKAISHVNREAEDALRQITRERVLAGAGRGESAEDIASSLEERGIKGFTDKAGRKWALTSYAKMVARTAEAEARTAGTLDTLEDEGVDLVQVSKHPHPHDICTPFEGRIFSVSGTSERYPPLVEAPPFHPNCKHFISAFMQAVQPQPPADENYTPEERDLYRRVTGEDIPADAGQAMLKLRDGEFGGEDQDALVALDDKFITRAQMPSAMQQAGLSRDKHGGIWTDVFDAFVWASDYGVGDRPAADIRAFSAYKRGGYGSINNGLRRSGGDPSALSDLDRERVEAMDRTFRDVPATDRAIGLLRKGFPPEVSKAFADRNEAGLIGQIFGDDGFGSTTLNKDWKSSAVGLGDTAHLVLPEGGKALWLEGITDIKGAPEYEMLLPRGTKYRITTAERDEDGRPIIEAEIILE